MPFFILSQRGFMDLIAYGLKNRLLTPVEARKAQQLRSQNMKAYFEYLSRFDFLPHLQNEDFKFSPPTEITRPDSLEQNSKTHEILPLCWKLLEDGIISASDLNQEILDLPTEERTPHKLLQTLFKNKKIIIQQFVELYPFLIQKEANQAKGYQVSFHQEGFPVFSQPKTIAQFGSFQILEQLGQGGMGTVFKALDALERTVALKKINVEREESTLSRQRFLNEAQVMATVEHPNIVRVYDYGSIENADYISMEYVEGQTLSHYLYDKPIALRTKIELLYQISQALSFLHSKKVWHRDLKPLNIMVTMQNQIKVMDFGLAKVEKQKFTKTGMLVGTPNYMSPEQIDSKRFGKPSFQSDIFSFGIIFYEMLAGKLPFVGMSLTEILRQILEKPLISPRIRNPNIPLDLELICFRCLEKSTKERYATMDEISAELERWLKGFPIKTKQASFVERTQKWAKRNKFFVGIGVTFLVVFLLVGVFQQWQERSYTKNLLQQGETSTAQGKYQEAFQTYTNCWPLDSVKTEQSLEVLLKAMIQKSSAEENLGSLLERFNLARQILLLKPQHPPFYESEFQLGTSVLLCALKSKDFRFADYIYQELAIRPESQKKIETLKQQINEAKNARKKHQLERLQFWVQKIIGSQIESYEMRSAINEVARFEEPAIKEQLLQYFHEASQNYEKNILLSPQKELLYKFVLEIFSRATPETAEAKEITQQLLTVCEKTWENEHFLENIQPSQISFYSLIFETIGNLREPVCRRMNVFREKIIQKKNKISYLDAIITKIDSVMLQLPWNEELENLETYEELMFAVKYAPESNKEDVYKEILKKFPSDKKIQKLYIDFLFYQGKKDEALDKMSELVKRYPQEIEFIEKYASLLKEAGKTEEALAFLEKISSEIKTQDLILLQIFFLEELGCYQEALDKINQALQKFPDQASILSFRVNIYLILDNYLSAIIDLKKLIELSPQNSTYYEKIIGCYIFSNQLQKAFLYINKAMFHFPNNYLLLYYDGLIKKKNGEIKKAKESFLQALILLEKETLGKDKESFSTVRKYRVSSENKKKIVNKVRIHIQLNQYEQALDSFHLYLQKSILLSDIILYGELVFSYYITKPQSIKQKLLLQDAIKRFENFDLKGKGTPSFWSILSRLYLLTNELEKLNNVLKKWEEIEPNSLFLLEQKGHNAFQQEKDQEALNYYKLYLAKDPESLRILLQVGLCHFNLKQVQNGIEVLEQMLQINQRTQELSHTPSLKIQAYSLLSDLYLKVPQEEKAVSLLKKAIQEFPQEIYFYKTLGSFYEQKKNHQELFLLFEYGSKQNPTDAFYPYEKGRALLQLGKHQEALDAFQESLELSAKHPESGLPLEFISTTKQLILDLKKHLKK